MVAILYSFRRCPYAMRARMALKYSGLKVQLREILLKDKPQQMLEISPKGTVPVLQLEDGKVIDESRDVMNFALQYNDPDSWKSPDAEGLIDENDGYFKEFLDKYKYHNRHPEHEAQDYRLKAEEFLKKLEDNLSKNQYLLSDKISQADIAIFPFIRQFAHVDKEWFYQTDYKKLQQWLDRFLEFELFEDIMEKYQPWKDGDDVVFL